MGKSSKSFISVDGNVFILRPVTEVPFGLFSRIRNKHRKISDSWPFECNLVSGICIFTGCRCKRWRVPLSHENERLGSWIPEGE